MEHYIICGADAQNETLRCRIARDIETAKTAKIWNTKDGHEVRYRDNHCPRVALIKLPGSLLFWPLTAPALAASSC